MRVRIALPGCAVAALLGLTGVASAATPTFGPANGPFSPGQIGGQQPIVGPPVVADVNGDGFQDLLSMAEPSGDLVVMRGADTSGGNFPAGSVFHYTAAGENQFLVPPAVGDLDRNGTPDVVTVGGTGTVTVLLNGNPGTAQDGSFTAEPNYTIPTSSSQNFEPAMAALADLNGDGYPDIVVGGYNSSYPDLAIFWNNGNGTFNSTPTMIEIGRASCRERV